MLGQNPLYLDNAATSHPKPEGVYRALTEVSRQGGSAGRGRHHQGLAGDRILFAARELLAELFGVDASERFVFTFNATHALNVALFGVLRAGDRVVTTSMEHNAVTRPLHALSQHGVEVVKVAADRVTGLVCQDDVKAACLAAPTRMLVMNHASNVNGTLQNLEGLGPWCRQHGIVLLVDGSQTAGMVPVNLSDLHLDLFAAPGHKGLLGPQGTGFLYIRDGLELEPLLYGGTGSHSSMDEQPRQLPERFESGTQNLPGIAGLKAGLEFLRTEGIAAIGEKETDLAGHLLSGLAAIDEVRVYGLPAGSSRTATVSFNVANMDPSAVGFFLDQRQIAVRTGLHCSADSHRTIGTFPAGTVRVSPGYFTTNRDLDSFLSQLKKLVRSTAKS